MVDRILSLALETDTGEGKLVFPAHSQYNNVKYL